MDARETSHKGSGPQLVKEVDILQLGLISSPRRLPHWLRLVAEQLTNFQLLEPVSPQHQKRIPLSNAGQ